MPDNENTKSQIKSRQRVAEHGEVFTNPREVNTMLDLVRDESFRLDSRFLEPACGDGNFLIEILRRKLSLLSSVKSSTEWEFQSLIAVGACYGIELLEDNAEACRERLCREVIDTYSRSLHTPSPLRGTPPNFRGRAGELEIASSYNYIVKRKTNLAPPLI